MKSIIILNGNKSDMVGETFTVFDQMLKVEKVSYDTSQGFSTLTCCKIFPIDWITDIDNVPSWKRLLVPWLDKAFEGFLSDIDYSNTIKKCINIPSDKVSLGKYNYFQAIPWSEAIESGYLEGGGR